MAKKEKVDEQIDRDASVDEGQIADDETEEPKEHKVTREELEHLAMEKAKAEGQKIIDAMKKVQYQALRSDCYADMDTEIEMVVDGDSVGCIIEGRGGIGKTFRTWNACKELNTAILNSFVTPQGFFIFLYKHKDDDIILVDDCAGFMNSDKIQAFLKQAFEDKHSDRNIMYVTPKPIKDPETGDYVPYAFTLHARIIIITNQLNRKSPHVQAILTRITPVEVNVPRKELLKLMHQIAEQNYEDITLDERREVLNWLETKSDESNSENLNIRTLFKWYGYKINSRRHNKGDFWKMKCLNMLKKENAEIIVQAILEDKDLASLSEDDRIVAFIEKTGKSRATYFRAKKRLIKGGFKMPKFDEVQNGAEKVSEETKA
jgi:hypothetical protein